MALVKWLDSRLLLGVWMEIKGQSIALGHVGSAEVEALAEFVIWGSEVPLLRNTLWLLTRLLHCSSVLRPHAATVLPDQRMKGIVFKSLIFCLVLVGALYTFFLDLEISLLLEIRNWLSLLLCCGESIFGSCIELCVNIYLFAAANLRHWTWPTILKLCLLRQLLHWTCSTSLLLPKQRWLHGPLPLTCPSSVFLITIFCDSENIWFPNSICFPCELLHEVNILLVITQKFRVITFVLIYLSQYFVDATILLIESGARVEPTLTGDEAAELVKVFSWLIDVILAIKVFKMFRLLHCLLLHQHLFLGCKCLWPPLRLNLIQILWVWRYNLCIFSSKLRLTELFPGYTHFLLYSCLWL